MPEPINHDLPQATAEHRPEPPPEQDRGESRGETPDQGLGTTVGDRPTTPHDAGPAADPDWPAPPGYRVEAFLAQGGMGRVYQGFDLVLGREVAIKTLRSAAHAERFVTEAKITARLPHPNIPPVHALGMLADGTPYLVMKCIHGRTLAELLRDRAEPLGQLSRDLQIFEQIAQAVGFAHRRGVIHRDLKPGNVMVGEFGEVQVMDWGIAKELARDSQSHDREGAEEGTNDAGQTRIGSVLGTPGFMAPEQARGEPVDARADVFALGSILCVILTGKPAVVGRDGVIERTARGDLTDARQRLTECGADPELIALARECLAGHADERPGDAQEVAGRVAAHRAAVEARLRDAQTALVREAEGRKRRRLLRGATVLLLLTMGVGLGVSLWQTRVAQLAEGRAVYERDVKGKTFGVTLETLRLLSDELVERQFARNESLTPEGREFLQSVSEGFRQLAELPGEDRDTRFLRAEGLGRIGNIRLRLGDLEAARKALVQCVSLLRSLVDEQPEDAESVRELALASHNLGLALSKLGQLDPAEGTYRDSLEAFARLEGLPPGKPTREGASEWTWDRARAQGSLALLYSMKGEPKKSEELYRTALGFWEGQLVRSPDSVPLQQGWSRTASNLVILLSGQGKMDEAIRLQERTVEHCERRTKGSPNTADFVQELAFALDGWGNLLREAGHPEEAEKAFDRSLVHYERLVGQFPGRAIYRHQLAGTYSNRGLLLREQGRSEGAEKALREAVGLQRALARDFPEHQEHRKELAANLLYLGGSLSERDQLDEAARLLDEAFALQTRLVEEDAKRPLFRQDLARTLMARAELFRRLKDTGKAEQNLRAALDIYRKLVDEQPREIVYQEERARCCNSLGGLCWLAKRAEEAETMHREALLAREQLHKAAPERPVFQYTLAGSHVNLGHVLRDTNRAQASLDHYRQAIELLRPLWERKRDNPSVPLFLRNAHWGRAEALQRLQRHADAITDVERALELDTKKELRTLPAMRVISLIRVAQTSEQLAQATAQTEQLLRSGGWPAARIYDFAVVYTLAAARTTDAAQKKAWTGQALSMFRQLLKTNAAMWKPRLESDRDLDSLRPRDDFKALLTGPPKP